MGLCMSETDTKIIKNPYLTPGEKIESMLAYTIGPTEYQNRVYDNKQKISRVELFDNTQYKKKQFVREFYWKY